MVANVINEVKTLKELADRLIFQHGEDAKVVGTLMVFEDCCDFPALYNINQTMEELED